MCMFVFLFLHSCFTLYYVKHCEIFPSKQNMKKKNERTNTHTNTYASVIYWYFLSWFHLSLRFILLPIFSSDKLFFNTQSNEKFQIKKCHQIQCEKMNTVFTFWNTIDADPIECVQEHFLIKNVHIIFALSSLVDCCFISFMSLLTVSFFPLLFAAD